MIRNQWYAVLESDEVPRGRPVGVTRMGEKLVFWRTPQGVVCQRDLCPHRGVALSAGKLCGERIQCPFHGFEYDSTGRCRLIPANGRNTPVPAAFQVDTYPTCEQHGLIFIWWGEPRPGLPPARFFDNIDDSFEHATARDPWRTHYSRAIENQLDAVHVPFIHDNTIGRGGRTVVDGPLVKWCDEDLMYVYVFNRADDGTPARRARELAVPDVPFHLEFLFPNLWQNHISQDVRVVIAFAPVDDEHTILYLRFYQRFLKAPLLGSLVTRLGMPFNLLVAHQDRRVVETQRPHRTYLRMGEKLIHGDNPIVAYRRRRDELLGTAQPAGAAESDKEPAL